MYFRERHVTYLAARRRNAVKKWIARLALLIFAFIGWHFVTEPPLKRAAVDVFDTVSQAVAWWWNSPQKIASR